VPGLRELGPGASDALVAVIVKLFAMDPGDRYADGVELLADLAGLGPRWVTFLVTPARSCAGTVI
jgi:hypothetical protein